ncbi:MAG TPA: hypothetical protein VGB87_07325 [Vicinamibacteria bacterium]
MGVRASSQAPLPRARSVGPGPGPTLVVVLAAFLPLVANGRPVGPADASGAAGWLLGGALALAGLAFELDAAGTALVGKLLAALLAALAAGALFSAVARRRGLGEGRWAGLLLAFGTTLAAAAQAWSGEAAATCAVAVAVLRLGRSEEDEEAAPAARAGLPLGLAVALQPSTTGLVLVLAGFVLLRWRKDGLAVLAWAAPGVLVALGALLASPAAAAGAGPSASPLALLVSPAKGALVFAPVGIVGLLGLARNLRAPARRLWDQAPPSRLLPTAFAVAALAHFAWLAVAGGWTAVDFWGPRWVAPAWPLLLAFLPEGTALLGTAGALLALVSVAVQALGAFSYDGRWDRLYRGSAGEMGPAAWSLRDSPIAFQVRERSARVALPGLDGRRLVVRPKVLAPQGAAGSFVSFGRGAPRATGVERTMAGVRLESGARVEGGRLVLAIAGDGLAFRVPEASRPRRLELRVSGRGTGTLGLGEGTFGRDTRWREKRVSGDFRLRLPYHHPESGGPDLVLSLRAGGPVTVESVALVPPTEPDDVLRLP